MSLSVFSSSCPGLPHRDLFDVRASRRRENPASSRWALALEFRDHGGNGLFRIAKEHARVVAKEQRVINTREA